jgi:predicted nucleic acid-binding protein
MIAVDSSVLIAGLLSWHEFHTRASSALQTLIARRAFLIPLPALIESYSVMTRLPSPHRLRPEIAYGLLHDSCDSARIASLGGGRAWAFLHECATAAIAGGRIYDATIAKVAIEAGAEELLTLNPRDFESFSDRITIVVP